MFSISFVQQIHSKSLGMWKGYFSVKMVVQKSKGLPL